MNELVIKTHLKKFEEAKNQLKKFSEEIPSSDLQSVETNSGPFGLFTHNITGKELNELIDKIQSKFIFINKLQSDTIKEFAEVYEALEALDKGYIQGIVAGIKAAEKASNQAKEAATKAEKNTIDINLIINGLVEFKERIEKIEYIQNMEKIWSDIQDIKKTSEQNNQLLKKVKIAYAIAGIFAVITLTHIILNVLGIL